MQQLFVSTILYLHISQGRSPISGQRSSHSTAVQGQSLKYRKMHDGTGKSASKQVLVEFQVGYLYC